MESATSSVLVAFLEVCTEDVVRCDILLRCFKGSSEIE